jgi:hypothetical protein
MSDDVDGRIRRLYQLPLAEFTEARNALALELKPHDKDAAARVKALAKPSASAWAANQVFWTARREFDALVDASDRLRAIQAAGATANELREVMRDRRDALAAALRKGEKALEREGHATSASVLQRMATTFEAFATWGSNRPPEIRPGLLSEDLSAHGFEAMGTLAPAAPRARPVRQDDNEPGTPAESRADEAPARAELAPLEAEVATRRRQAAAAQTAAEEAAQRAEGASSELLEAERRLAKAGERAREAGEAAKQAQAEAARTARELAAAERKLEAARK